MSLGAQTFRPYLIKVCFIGFMLVIFGVLVFEHAALRLEAAFGLHSAERALGQELLDVNDLDAAVVWICRAADGGDAEAQQLRARYFARNIADYYSWMKRSADAGNIHGMYYLAEFYDPDDTLVMYLPWARAHSVESLGNDRNTLRDGRNKSKAYICYVCTKALINKKAEYMAQYNSIENDIQAAQRRLTESELNDARMQISTFIHNHPTLVEKGFDVLDSI